MQMSSNIVNGPKSNNF